MGSQCEHFPEPSKSTSVMFKQNVEAALTHFEEFNFTTRTGNHCLGGFPGNQDDHDTWLNEKTQFWSQAITDLASAANPCPQSAHAGLHKSLQHEWQFVQWVTPGIENHFPPLEEAISKAFSPALFGEQGEDAFSETQLCCSFAALPVKHLGLALPNPVKEADQNCQTSTMLVESCLLSTLRGSTSFGSSDHLST